jgi:glucose/arabinose dehydrogenase
MRRKLGGFAAGLGLSTLLFTALIVALAARAPSAVTPEVARETGVAKPASVPERLPDLDQETPTELQVQNSVVDGQRSYRLGFRSAVRNIGDGPLIVRGSRPDTRHPTMKVDQFIDRADGSQEVIHNVGRMQYAVSEDHEHWHYFGFEHYALQSYALRPASSSHVLARDAKTGFCLGDRYRVTTRPLRAAPREPVFTSNCGILDRDRLHIREGISVAYGDDYSAFLEGQDLPLDGLPDGRYVLVHRVNEDRGIRELSYANNASSVLLQLHWRDGVPYLRVLQTCPDTAECDRSLEVRTVATGLEIPWDIGFLPDGSALVTERPGRVRLIDAAGHLRADPVAQVDVATQGEGGLLGLAVDPDFANDRLVYLYYTSHDEMRLERWRWNGSTLERDTSLVNGIQAGEVHDSGRIGFGPDGRLYVATGDAGHPELAQDALSLNGKLLALTPEQYRGLGPIRPAIVASGLRNSQGFDWQPGTGILIANDHGPSGFDGPEGYDEVNEIVQGGNYGWPDVIGYDTDRGRFLAPLRVYRDPIAPSAGTFVTQPGSAWRGDYILAALRGESLHRLELSGGRIVVDEPLLDDRFGRLRTVKEGPNGCLYLLTSNRDGRGTPRAGDDRVLCVRLPHS